MRVVGDRMMMRQDMVKLKALISSTIVDHFGNDLGIDKLVDGSGDASSEFWRSKIYEVCELKKKPLIFTDLVGSEGYIELTRLERAQDILKECATKLCENAVMNGDPVPAIVPFHFTVKHFLRASRILSKTNNHILMTGHASSGKHTVMQLVAQAHGVEYQEVNVDKIKLFCMWGSVLRNILLKAAKKISIVLVIRCNDIYDDVFHDLYCILKGRFKHLLDHDTVMQVCERFRDDAVSANARGELEGGKMITASLSDEDVFHYFEMTAAKHIKVAITTNGTKYLYHLWNNHAPLMQFFSVDSFSSWDKSTLKDAATEIFQLSNAPLEGEQIKAISESAIEIHKCTDLVAQENDVSLSQKEFLGMCYLFRNFTDRYFESSVSRRAKYEFALDKLMETEEDVSTMKEEIAGMKPLLDRKIEKANAVMKTVNTERTVVSAHIRSIKQDEAEIARQTKVADEKRTYCKQQLADARPVLLSALDAVKSLQKKDLDEVKAMKKPPAKVKIVMEAICIMLGLPPRRVADPNDKSRKIDDYWASSVAILGNSQALLVSLEQYHDHHEIQEIVIQRIESEYICQPYFSPDEVRRASVACEGLCRWIIGMVKYFRITQKIKPQQAALKEAESDVKFAMELLAKKQKNVIAAEKRLKQLEKQLTRASDDKKSLQDEVQELSNKIKAATDMVMRLEAERVRWEGE